MFRKAKGMDTTKTLRVRYSTFEDCDADIEDYSPRVEEDHDENLFDVQRVEASQTLVFRGLRRNRSGSTDLRKLAKEPKKVEEPIVTALEHRPAGVGTKKPRKLSKAERLCVALLRERIADVVGEMHKKRVRPHTVFESSKPNNDVTKGRGPKTGRRPTTQGDLVRTGSATSAFSKDLTDDESKMLKKVLSDILRRKMKYESQSQGGDKSAEPTSSSLPEVETGKNSQDGSRKSTTEKCLGVIKDKVKKKLKGFTDDVRSRDGVTSSGDMSRGANKRESTKDQRGPNLGLFSLASSSRGSTAEWVIKQQFEEHRGNVH